VPNANNNSVSKSEHALQQEANKLFAEAKKKARVLEESFLEVAKITYGLKKDSLWKYVTDANGKHRFRQWTEVLDAVLGRMSRKRAYDLLACFELTQGPDPIADSEIRKMGISRAAQVGRLEPEQRTPAIRQMAKTRPVMEVRNEVQKILNRDLPKHEQKPMLKLVAMNLPADIAEELEELIEVMGYTDGARDGDTSLAIRAKAVQLIIIGAEEYWAQELSEGLKRMRAAAGKDASPAAEGEDWSDFPDQEDGFVVSAADEDAKSAIADLRLLPVGPSS